jgi:NAD(P)-dependent dehydrogenase (short-subunit alcohol dehydrogenase family)
MSELNGKVAVVTGASKGIGAAIAKALSAAGAAVVVNYSASKEDADRIVADIKAKGGKAIAVKGDVAKADDMVRLFEETKKTFGRMDDNLRAHLAEASSRVSAIGRAYERLAYDPDVESINLGPYLKEVCADAISGHC